MKKHEKKPFTMNKKLIIGATIAVAAVGLFFIGKYIYQTAIDPISAFSGLPEPAPAVITAPTASAPQPEQPADITPTPEPTIDLNDVDKEFMKNRVNVLLLGLDESAERANWGSFRTDTMILLSVDFETKDIHMISIPRDSYVKIYNKDSRAKVNSAFVTGGGAKKNGFEYACKTISVLLGNVPVNYYVGFNMQVVKDVVNAMDGVDYVVDIDVKMNGRTLVPSETPQHLDGQMVLDYCRMRKGSSDIARADRQQRMMFAIFAQLKKTKQITQIPKIFQAVESNIGTNLNFTQISALALLATSIDMDNLQRHMVPGEFLTLRKTSYWGVSEAGRVKLIKDVFGINAQMDPSGDVKAIKAELEANRALIASELSQADAGIKQCKAWLASAADSLSAEDKDIINAAIKKLQEAYDAEDKTELDDAISYYHSVASYINGKLGTGISTPATEPPVQPEVVTPAPVETPTPAPVVPTPTPTSSFVIIPSYTAQTGGWVPPVN